MTNKSLPAHSIQSTGEHQPGNSPPGRVINAISIDVEDYYQVAAFEDIVSYADWERYDSHVCKNTHRLLEVFSEHSVCATFFILGWVAERHPQLVRSIQNQGHEIGCHGYKHVRINFQTPDAFREDVRHAKSVIEQCIGEPIHGYRAASFSVRSDTLWALEILLQEGFQYDSSIFPIVHDRYGISDAPRFPYQVSTPSGVITEFPLTTTRYLHRNVPVAGGGYFRLLPYCLTRNAIEKTNRQEGMPAVFYLHPWEIDLSQPRLDASWTNRVRHYTNIQRTEQRLQTLLHDFEFSTLRTTLSQVPLRTYEIKQAENGHLRFQSVPKEITFFDNTLPTTSARKISVIIPVYNEMDNMAPLCQELSQVFLPLRIASEWIFVDDGSTDDSIAQLVALKELYPQIVIIKLRRNFGQTPAMQAGFDHATGDVVVTMDADLQNDPHDIPCLLRRLDEGFDLVCGWRKNRKDPWLSRKLPSQVANKMIQRIIGSNIHDRGCSLKIYRAGLTKKFRLYSEMHRFIHEISIMTGARVSELVVNHRPRQFGTSKYGISRTFKVLSDVCSLKLITRFSAKPMVGFLSLSLPIAIAAAVTVLVALWNMSTSSASDPAIVVSGGVALLLFAASCFFLLLGVIGEMVIANAPRRVNHATRMILEEGKHE